MAMRFAHASGVLMLGVGHALFSSYTSLWPANDLFAGTRDTDTNITRHQGRFPARYMQNNVEQNAVGSFLRRERGPDVQLELMSSLGRTLAIVSQSNQGVTLELPNQLPRRTPKVNTLMQDTLGFSLPISGLRGWLCARSAFDALARTVRDTQSRLGTIE